MTKVLKFFFLSSVILTLLPAHSFAAPPIPATPAGAALGAWLTSFNSGDASSLKAFYDSYNWKYGRIEEDQKLRSTTGELALLRVTLDEKFEIQALLKESKSGIRIRIRILINEKNPPSIDGIMLLTGTTPFPK